MFDVITVEQRFATNKALRMASKFDGVTVFPVNYPIKLDGRDTKIPFPFVLEGNKAHLFTKDDAALELNIQ